MTQEDPGINPPWPKMTPGLPNMNQGWPHDDQRWSKVDPRVTCWGSSRWSCCTPSASCTDTHWQCQFYFITGPNIRYLYCQAQIQSQIQVPKPGPKSQIQSPEERDWDWGWHYNPTSHPHITFLTWNVNLVMGKDHPWPSLTFLDLPWPSMTFHDLLWPSMTFYHLLRPLWPSMIKWLKDLL